MSTFCIASILSLLVSADVRLDFNQTGAESSQIALTPSTWGYANLVLQKRNNNDQFWRSNIDNEQNKRKPDSEIAQDMLPFRQPAAGMVMDVTIGKPITLPIRWNNMHDSSCEVNIWMDNQTTVVPIKRPFNCGGGYANQRFFATIPNDFVGCSQATDNCVLQIYAHSVEPRTYAMALNIVVKNATAPALAKRHLRLAKRQLANSTSLTNSTTPVNGTTTYAPVLSGALPNTKDIPNAVKQKVKISIRN
jgi:hypothetical protein